MKKTYLRSRVPYHCSQDSIILLDTPQTAPGCITGAHMKQQHWIIVGCMRLGSLSVTSPIRAPSKQHTFPESVSGWQMGASVPLRRGSPSTITHCFFLVVLAVIQGADQTALLSSSIPPDVMGPSFSVCRAVKQACKGTSGFRGSLFLLLILAVAMFLYIIARPPPPSVCAGRGVFGCLAVGSLQTALGTSYLTRSQPP